MKSIIYGVIAASVLLLGSCNDKQKLAEDIAGTWSGAPERLIDKSASTATIVETYSFFPGDNADDGGNVTLSALISVTGQISGTNAVIQPFSLSAAAVASIEGTWTAVSDDDVRLDWNDSTLAVRVDPSAVVLSTDLLTGSSAPMVDSLKPQLAESIRAQIAQAVELRFLGTRRLEDIKIKNDEMKYEVGDVDRIMQRQGPAEAE